LCAGRAHALACGRLGTLDERALGDTILPRREARHIGHVIAPPKAEELADPRHGLAQGQRVGVMMVGRCAHRECDIVQELLVRGAQGHVDLDAGFAQKIGS
jgi:hypothetical protein